LVPKFLTLNDLEPHSGGLFTIQLMQHCAATSATAELLFLEITSWNCAVGRANQL